MKTPPHTPFPDSSTEPLKGSDSDSRSGSISEDVSGDFSPSISFSVVRGIKELSCATAYVDVLSNELSEEIIYLARWTARAYRKDPGRLITKSPSPSQDCRPAFQLGDKMHNVYKSELKPNKADKVIYGL